MDNSRDGREERKKIVANAINVILFRNLLNQDFINVD